MVFETYKPNETKARGREASELHALLADFDTAKQRLNDEMWVLAGNLPPGLETALHTMEAMILNLDRRLRKGS